MERSQPTKEKSPGMSARATELITQGKTLDVMKLTGWAYALTGIVVEGNRIGRTLGYPTANLDLPDNDRVIPAQGVYAAMVYLEKKWFASMVNIGIRPTLNLHKVTIEAHLFDFMQDLYGKTISIHFLSPIRNEMRFSSLSELKEQLHIDKEIVRKSIAGTRPHMQLTEEGLRWIRSS